MLLLFRICDELIFFLIYKFCYKSTVYEAKSGNRKRGGKIIKERRRGISEGGFWEGGKFVIFAELGKRETDAH